jgi:hypothetical protein
MLIKDTTKLKEILSTIQVNFSPKTIMPFVEQAELKYIIEVLGQEFFDELDAANEATPTAQQEAAIVRLQKAIAYYALYDSVPFINVAIGDAGIGASGSMNQQAAARWTVDSLSEAAAKNADVFIEQALIFLEKNANDYPTWKTSDYYTESKEMVIGTTAELSKYINIRNSRRTFLLLRNYIERATDMYLLNAIDSTVYEEVMAERANNTLTDENAKRLKMMQKVVAQYTLVEALPEVMFDNSEGGFKVLSFDDGVRSKKALTATEATSLQKKAEKLGQRFLAELQKYLDEVSQTEFKTPPPYKLPEQSQTGAFRT